MRDTTDEVAMKVSSRVGASYVILLFLVMVIGSAAYARSNAPAGPRQLACVRDGGNWNVIYDPDYACSAEDCGHCFAKNDCQLLGPSVWDSFQRACLFNGHMLTDYPGYCNGAINGDAPDGGYNRYSHPPLGNCGVSRSSAGDGSSGGDVHCPPGYAPNDMGGCTLVDTGTGFFCVDHPLDLSCTRFSGFVFVNLPPDENCLEHMEVEDPPLNPHTTVCGPDIVAAPGSAGNDCLSSGRSIGLDAAGRGLVCWSGANASAPRVRLAVPRYDDSAKYILKHCWSKGGSVTLQGRAFGCVETPAEVKQATARHFIGRYQNGGTATPGALESTTIKTSKSNGSELTGIVKLPEGTELTTPRRATHGQTVGETRDTQDGCTKDQAMSDEASKGSVSSFKTAQGSAAPAANPCDAGARPTSKSH